MVFLTGDTHIPIDADKLDFPEQEQMTRDDYIIVLGDFGLLWHWDATFEHYLEWLKKRPYTLLWLDGNHENHEWIQSMPKAKWHGGTAHYVAENIIHLARGSIFDIEGKQFFVMGGALSIDRDFRAEGESWWEGEIPTMAEAQRGLKNIEAHHANGLKIDYVLTHTCPERLIKPMFHVNPVGDETCRWLAVVEDLVEDEMTGWYFGHWHEDIDRWKYHCLYDRVMRLL